MCLKEKIELERQLLYEDNNITKKETDKILTENIKFSKDIYADPYIHYTALLLFLFISIIIMII